MITSSFSKKIMLPGEEHYFFWPSFSIKFYKGES
jgi:hypothetical protein